jgi:hypothetical protein
MESENENIINGTTFTGKIRLNSKYGGYMKISKEIVSVMGLKNDSTLEITFFTDDKEYRVVKKIQKSPSFSVYLSETDLEVIGVICKEKNNRYVVGTEVKVSLSILL